ncbi:hypothetical protein A3D03_05835 [Candidatus Gottesmanbacteria bacterium RIFCSPHIGHO2_02_FULL_40_13]|uniref:Gas vesicle protein n=1 Tax=Candidatus Gottesmanbacteria bacterium RIFCSPHIGHO2_02_FULL_40_13 TaxID=1798384 RepID=A0A1F6A8Q6_9BACT|nr:MAG: hypothetical protein A3D03_05835 [Candidatus Gottesmanbacteria bacterium RIFCSPHIGHO2_02_FULL_40_13]
MNDNSHKSGNFWLGFFLGGLIGAFIIFVLGTKEGKKISRFLEDEEKDVKNKIDDKIHTLKTRSEKYLEEAGDLQKKVKQEVAAGAQKVSQTLVDRLDDSLGQLQEVQKKGVELTEAVRNRFFKKNGKHLSS